MTKKSSQEVQTEGTTKIIDPFIRELLRDIEELTTRQFVYDSRWGEFVPASPALHERQTGPPAPFAALTWREKSDVLRQFIRWDHYAQQGLDWRDAHAIENNISLDKPRHRWLEGTLVSEGFRTPEDRETLIRETFELSHEIGYGNFLAENFGRADPTLLRLGPKERIAFLRQWWDAASDRMHESYLGQVAGMSNEDLARNRQAYKEIIATADSTNHSMKTSAQSPSESPGQVSPGDQQHSITDSLRDALFAPTVSDSLPVEPPQEPEHIQQRQPKR